MVYKVNGKCIYITSISLECPVIHNVQGVKNSGIYAGLP